MDDTSIASLTEQFSKLKDPRVDRTKRHKLIDVVVIAICAVIGGADTWADVELFGKSKEDWLSRLIELPNGIPSHDTFGRVFAMLDAEQFQECFVDWVRAVSEVTGGQLVAIDGKTVPALTRQIHRQGSDPYGERLGIGESSGAGTDQSG